MQRWRLCRLICFFSGNALRFHCTEQHYHLYSYAYLFINSPQLIAQSPRHAGCIRTVCKPPCAMLQLTLFDTSYPLQSTPLRLPLSRKDNNTHQADIYSYASNHRLMRTASINLFYLLPQKMRLVVHCQQPSIASSIPVPDAGLP